MTHRKADSPRVAAAAAEPGAGASMGREDVEIVGREVAFQGFFAVDRVTLRHRLFAGDWSGTFTRELFRRGRSVGVLLHDPALSQLVLVEQFRVGLLNDKHRSPWVLELVAGMVDAGEEAPDVAVRETQEETGLDVGELTHICEYYNSPGGSDECISLFYGQVDASEAGGIYGLASENEDIRVVVMDVTEAWQGLDQGRFNNAMILIALQWLRQRLSTGERVQHADSVTHGPGSGVELDCDAAQGRDS